MEKTLRVWSSKLAEILPSRQCFLGENSERYAEGAWLERNLNSRRSGLEFKLGRMYDESHAPSFYLFSLSRPFYVNDHSLWIQVRLEFFGSSWACEEGTGASESPGSIGTSVSTIRACENTSRVPSDVPSGTSGDTAADFSTDATDATDATEKAA